MKKTLSIVILVCMIAGIMAGAFTITAAAATTKAELGEKIAEARELYFTGGSEQTRKYLYGKLASADAVMIDDSASQSEIDAAYDGLAAAVTGFAPMTVSGRTEINGVSHWSDDLLANMQTDGLSAHRLLTSKLGLLLTLDGEFGEETSGRFFNKPGEDGACSPFGTEMYFTDGLAFEFLNDNRAIDSVDIYIGTKNNDKEELLSVYDVPVPEDGTVYIPWEIFCPEPVTPEAKVDLSGAMNILGFDVYGHSMTSFYIFDVYAFSETIERDDRMYEEVKVNSFSEIDNDHVYKISDPATGKVVTWGPALTETVFKQQASSGRLDWTSSNQSYSLSDGNGDDVTQQWQIYKQLRSGDYHIINQGTSATMTRGNTLGIIENGKLTLERHEKLDNSYQKWSVTESNGRFVFKSGSKYLGVSGDAPALVSSAYEWDVYECVTDEWVEVWGDEFNGASLDRTKWIPAIGHTRGATEPQYHRDDANNLYLKDGNLVIRTAKEDYKDYHATSAWIDTEGIYGVTYGKIEMRAKLTDGKRSWPAFWAMGQYGNWPYNGELDMFEYDINDNASDPYAVYATNHWFTYQGNLYGSDTSNDYMIHAAKGTTIYNENNEVYSNDYHIFSVEWDENQVRSYVDGMLYMSMLLTTDELRWGFGDNPHYLIVNVSVKGPGSNQVHDDMAAETFMYVDYVRVYKRAGEISEVTAYDDEVLNASKVVTGSSWMCALDVSPDGRYVASADRGTAYLTDTADNSLLKSNNCGYNEISKLLFSADGSKLAVASRGGHVVVLSSPAFTKISDGKFPNVFVESVAFNSNGTKLFAGGRITDEGDSSGIIPSKDVSQYLYVMDVATGAVTEGPFTGSNVRTLALSPDGTKLAAACANGKIFIYSILNGSTLTEYAQFTDHIRCARGLAWSPDGSLLATTDEGGKIFVYDVVAKSMKYEAANVSRASIRTCEFSPDGTKLLVSGSADGGRLFDAQTGKLISVMGGFSQAVPTARWSPDGKMILMMSLDGYGRLYTANGEYLRTLNGRQDTCYAVHDAVFAADGTKIYGITFHSKANTLCWDLGTGTLDTSELVEALRDASAADPSEYSNRAWNILTGYKNKYKKLARTYTAAQADVTAAAKTIKCAVALKDNKIFGFDPWQTSDTMLMTLTGCSATMRDVTEDENVYNSLCVFSKKTKWEFTNKTGDVIVKDPFVADMRDYSGLTFSVYATKAVTDSDILIGYTGENGDTIYKYNVGAIGTEAQRITAPFDRFERVSGDESLDMSKLELIGFTGAGKSTTGVYYYDLAAYQNEGEVPEVYGVEDGGFYDPPVRIDWNVGRAELNGEEIEHGFTVFDPGEYLLKVINLDKQVTVRFFVNENAGPRPGDADGDGEITVSDALICLRVAAGLMTVDANCDVDGDGEVGVTDAIALLRIALGILPNGGIRGIALICDAPPENDEGFNKAAFDAIRDFAESRNIYYSAYYPLGEDFDNRMMFDDAARETCNVFIVTGFMLAETLAEKAPEYPDCKFIAVDITMDDLKEFAGDEEADFSNVYCVTYREDVAGFLAGYAAVMLGYNNLGFVGGMEIPAVTRYGYGFLQGADAAASSIGITANVKFAYANSFGPSQELTAAMDAWYKDGVKAIFACGGAIYASVAEAAAGNNGKVIGVDADQSHLIDSEYGIGRTLTSAMKGVYATTADALEAIEQRRWNSAYAGVDARLGVVSAEEPERNYVQLPLEGTQWAEMMFDREGYCVLLSQLLDGTLTVSGDIDSEPVLASATVDYIELFR